MSVRGSGNHQSQAASSQTNTWFGDSNGADQMKLDSTDTLRETERKKTEAARDTQKLVHVLQKKI